MPITALLSAMNEYLDKDRLLAGGDPGGKEALLRDLDAARSALEGEVKRFSEERSQPGAIRSILVAFDDSEPSHRALDEALRIAAAVGARVSLVHVIDATPVVASEYAYDDSMARAALVRVGSDLLRRVGGKIPADLRGQTSLRQGDSAQEILAAAEELGADLIVIGTHGRGLLGRFLLGSVADAVVRHADCPVLTVGHRPATGRTGANSTRGLQSPTPDGA